MLVLLGLVPERVDWELSGTEEAHLCLLVRTLLLLEPNLRDLLEGVAVTCFVGDGLAHVLVETIVQVVFPELAK